MSVSNIQKLFFARLQRQPDQRYQSGIIQGAVQAAIFGDSSQQIVGYGLEAVVGEVRQAATAFLEGAVMRV